VFSQEHVEVATALGVASDSIPSNQLNLIDMIAEVEAEKKEEPPEQEISFEL